METLKAVEQIKKELPGVKTILGVSNISFGLDAYPRRVLNSVFMHEAVDHGLDLAIVNYTKIYQLYKIPQEEVGPGAKANSPRRQLGWRLTPDVHGTFCRHERQAFGFDHGTCGYAIDRKQVEVRHHQWREVRW